MKKQLLFTLIFVSIALCSIAQGYEYKIVTVVESIIPNGLGRSRMISANDTRNYKEFTTTQTEDDNDRNKSDRSDIRVKGYDETKLLNL